MRRWFWIGTYVEGSSRGLFGDIITAMISNDWATPRRTAFKLPGHQTENQTWDLLQNEALVLSTFGVCVCVCVPLIIL
jgi:hypothetical protein